MVVIKMYDTRRRSGRRALELLDRRNDATLNATIMRKAADIVDRVRLDGDQGLRRMVRRHDRHNVRRIEELRLVPERVAEAELPAAFSPALASAMATVDRYHRAQIREGHRLMSDGVELIERRRPLRRVGVYVPGGRACYPSTAVMTVLPARLAGVKEIVVVTPIQSYLANAALRHTLAELEVDEVWGLGGAHAIGALAYGTESIKRVDKIVGPGNAWVTSAKHLVSADVAIDGLAGPSEVVIVATGSADPCRIGADLLAQAEHDPQAMAVLVTDSKVLADSVRREVKRQISGLATAKVARAALKTRGCTFLVEGMEEALELVERIAPEHLQLVGAGAEVLADRVTASGAVFIGADSPEVFGDYVAGPSHVLPTGGTARFASALGIEDFVRRSHQIRYSPEAARRDAVAAAALADVEGLPGHAAAARLRLRGEGQ